MKKSKSILSVPPIHMVKPYTYSHSFQSLAWHQRLLQYLGSGRLIADYEFQCRRGLPLMQSQMPNVSKAISQIEEDIKRIASHSFEMAMGELYRLLQYADNSNSTFDFEKAGLLRLALQHTFPGHTDLLQMKNWPLWSLTVYTFKDNLTCTIMFNEPTKEDAYNRIVQAYLESEENGPDKAWKIQDVASVDKNLTNSTSLILDFMQFADPLIGDAFAIPVLVPDDAWVQGGQLDFIEPPTYIQTNDIYSHQGMKGTTT